MFSVELKRLTRRLFLLAMLVASLTLLTQTQSARATICCSTCEANFLTCFNNCHNVPSCQENCYRAYEGCDAICDIEC